MMLKKVSANAKYCKVSSFFLLAIQQKTILGKIINNFGVLFKKKDDINVVMIMHDSSKKNIYSKISKNFVFLFNLILEKIYTKNIPKRVPRKNDIKAFVPTLKNEKEKSVPKASDLDKRYISLNLYLLIFKFKYQSFLIY